MTEQRHVGEMPGTPAPLARIQQNWLARHERALLTWLCAHMPAWINPDRLTALGLVGAIMVFSGYAASNLGPPGWRSRSPAISSTGLAICSTAAWRAIARSSGRPTAISSTIAAMGWRPC